MYSFDSIVCWIVCTYLDEVVPSMMHILVPVLHASVNRCSL